MSLWYAATWIGLQLLTALAFNTGQSLTQIAIWTHIGGFLTGLLAARLWGKGPRPY
jgi:membrane associated rhomboid family serine protease